MLLPRVCDRAIESMIDELTMCAIDNSYPVGFGVFIDGLIDLTESQLIRRYHCIDEEVPEDCIVGAYLIDTLFCSNFVCTYRNNEKLMFCFTELIIDICEVSDRFKNSFIGMMNDTKMGYKENLPIYGVAITKLCEEVMKSISR